MNLVTKNVLLRGGIYITIPLFLEVMLCIFWRDTAWFGGAFFALGYLTAAFASLTLIQYRRVNDLKIYWSMVYLSFGWFGLALVSVVASIQSAFGH